MLCTDVTFIFAIKTQMKSTFDIWSELGKLSRKHFFQRFYKIRTDLRFTIQNQT